MSAQFSEQKEAGKADLRPWASKGDASVVAEAPKSRIKEKTRRLPRNLG